MSHLQTEIAEQPDVIRRLVEQSAPGLDTLAAILARHDIEHVVIAARGSSDNVARYGQYLLGLLHRLPVALATPSLQTIYGVAPRFGRALVVGVSQSGRSPDVVGVLTEARKQGRPTVALTNAPASPLAGAADHVIDLAAGDERSVAATKTYTASLTAVALLALALGDRSRRREGLAELEALPAVVSRLLASTPVERAERLVEIEHLLVAGRGLNYATAFETALKIRELTGTVAEAFSPPDLLHGPVAAVTPDAAALLVAPGEPSLASLRELVPPLRDRGARVGAISADVELLAAADPAFPLSDEPAAWLTPVSTIVPAQLIAAQTAALRGLDLDRPEGLTKITETR